VGAAEGSSLPGEWYVPDGRAREEAARRTTHLGIGAHPDDLEFLAYPSVLTCYDAEDFWFAGVVCTDGAGSPGAGETGKPDLAEVRAAEQRKAAEIGRYSLVVQLGGASSALGEEAGLVRLAGQLRELLRATRPAVLCGHHPLDAHPTHRRVFAATLRALRELPGEDRPQAWYGGEVWGGLEWIPAPFRVSFAVDDKPLLLSRLIEVYRSQIEGGKRYDFAVPGRLAANATFAEPHEVDRSRWLSHAVDLGELLGEDTGGVTSWVERVLEAHRALWRSRWE